MKKHEVKLEIRADDEHLKLLTWVLDSIDLNLNLYGYVGESVRVLFSTVQDEAVN